MNAWDTFKQRGDDWLAFLTLVGVAAQGQPDMIPPGALRLVIFGTTVATIAHKVFFPNGAARIVGTPDPKAPSSP